jgi:5-methylcytosine-specific restriction protein A
MALHPLCVCCLAHGVSASAVVLDHIVPHKGNQSLFWDPDNWQGLCEWCDKRLKRPIENRWLSKGGDVAELRLDRIVPGWAR